MGRPKGSINGGVPSYHKIQDISRGYKPDLKPTPYLLAMHNRAKMQNINLLYVIEDALKFAYENDPKYQLCHVSRQELEKRFLSTLSDEELIQMTIERERQS